MSGAMQHTPGPLRYDFEPGYCGELVASNGETVATFSDEPTEANARRLVACWNACEGASTEILEKLAAIPEKQIATYEKLEAQRDELLAALKLVMPALGAMRMMWPRSPHDDSVDVVEVARAAIANVKGGAA